MRYYVIMNGVNSLTIQGLAIRELPPISKPLMRNLREEIDGRNGDIITELGYSAYDKELEIGLYGNSYDINDIIAFFNGKGTITFSDEPDKYYYYQILNQIDYEKLLKFKTATVIFHCQPFKYKVNEVPLEEEYEYVEGEGTNITLNNTANAIFSEFDLKGNTDQYTTTGKNLLPNNQTTQTINGITFTMNSDKSVSIRGTATTNTDYYFVGTTTQYVDFGLTTGTYNLNGCVGGSEQTYMLFTVMNRNGNIYYYNNTYAGGRSMIVETGDKFRIFIRVISGTNVNTTIYPQLEVGNAATSYEPYTGGIPSPNPDYPQDIDVVTGGNYINIYGKNLLKLTNGSNVSQGVTITINNNKMSFVGTPTRAYVGSAEMPLYLKKGTYTFSSTNGVNSFFLWFKNQSGNVFTSVAIRPNPSTVTINEDATAIQIGLEGLTVGTPCNVESYFQLELGNSATEYEELSQQIYEVNLGKNLFDKSIANLNKAVSTGTGNLYSDTNCFATDFIEVKSNGTYYTASGYSTSTNRVYGAQYDSNKQYVGAIATNAGTKTFYISNANTKYIRLTGLSSEIDTYQLEKGTETTSYASYKEPIELCKIGDYQDRFYKDSGKWYIERQIKKIVLDGTQNITLASGTPRRFNASYTVLGIDNVKSGASATETQENYRMCDHFTYANGQTTWGNYYLHNNWLVILDNNSVIADANALKNWLANNNTTIYYVLATPTNEEITNEELINQLDALMLAQSQEGQTNIIQSTFNLPFIIKVSALKQNSDHLIINNIGNTFAKPTLDLEGTGIVDIYLNDVEVFQVDLSVVNEIVLNTAEMEAYNPNTHQLANRQVTGDYSNFKLDVGENDLRFSGNLTKATVTYYQRWL